MRDHAHTLSDFRVPTLSIVANPAAAAGATTSPGSSRNTATQSCRTSYQARRLPEGEIVQHPYRCKVMSGSDSRPEHAGDVERMICVDLAPNPAPAASACHPARVFVPKAQARPGSQV
jgi:hypothetical protein